MIYEPVSRNTAPAIALAVKFCLEKLNCNQDEVIFVTPSDHIIKPISKFAEYLRESQKVAKKDYIVIFGIVPNAPKLDIAT
ncbi:MAG: sugar phosphate nucleotidyltransferase [Candidatus Aenigmatarchaeota archaeon]